jgi:hypothetical protein
MASGECKGRRQELYSIDHIELVESKPMKNLLETEFIIENCTLSQRLAIKAYCDEKKIAHENLEVPSYKTLTFSKGKFRGFVNSVVQRDVVTFSELIQFLDQYQPEPEFKVGDHIIFYNETYKDIRVLVEKCTNGFIDTIKEFRNTSEKGLYKHATPEEIKKWKEENEIKLPKIADYEGQAGNIGYLKWGCTEISVSTVKELLGLNLRRMTIKTLDISESQIQQIKKFIEHNEL